MNYALNCCPIHRILQIWPLAITGFSIYEKDTQGNNKATKSQKSVEMNISLLKEGTFMNKMENLKTLFCLITPEIYRVMIEWCVWKKKINVYFFNLKIVILLFIPYDF